MSIQLRSIISSGELSRERVTLRVLSPADLGDYLLLRTGLSEGEVTLETDQSFWFPYLQVAAGDLIIVYTKRGKPSSKKLDSGHFAHFFYWGKSSALWGSEVGVVLLYTPTWEGKSVSQLARPNT